MTYRLSTLAAATAFTLLAMPAAAADVPLSPAPTLSTAKDAQGRPLPFGVPKYETPETPLGTGPSKAIMATETSLPQHVLYYPANLDAAGKLPVISWGNGGCIHAGNRFRGFLTEIASYGFLVISAGTMGHVSLEVGPQENPAVRRPGDPPPPPPAPPPADDPSAPWRAQRSNAEHLRQAIDWALAENARPGSKFYNRLDVSKIAVAGQSCGGFLATQAAVDPRVTTLAMFNSGQMMGDVTTPEGQRARANLDGIHTPVMYLLGEKEQEILFDAGAQNFAYLNDTPVFYAWQDGLQHIGTYGAPGGGSIGRIGVAWFQWQLKGDQAAGRMFRGADCLLCVEPTWHVQKKRID